MFTLTGDPNPSVHVSTGSALAVESYLKPGVFLAYAYVLGLGLEPVARHTITSIY